MGRHKTTATLSARVKIATKHRIEELAQKSLMSVNKYLVRLIERTAWKGKRIES